MRIARRFLPIISEPLWASEPFGRKGKVIMQEQKKQSFVQGAALLAAAVFIVKILGALYKIPLGNILGDEGTTHFGVAYNIYSLLLTLSTAGLPVALSRMISASNALGRANQVKRTFSVARMTFFVFGMVGTLIMVLFPTKLAAMMDDPEATQSILVLGPAVVLVCIMSAYRGYTQGLSDMLPTSVSQVLEVLCKLVFGLSLAWLFLSKGLGLPVASAGAIAGVTIGSLVALLYIVAYKLRMDRGTLRTSAAPDVPASRGRTFAQLIKIGIPVTIGSAVINIIALIDTKLILNRLQFGAGFSFEQSKILYGVYFKVQTLFNLPSAFIVPLTISVIPAISAYIAQKKFSEAANVTGAALKLCVLLGLPAGIGMSVLCYPIMNVIYPGSNAEGPTLLAILGIASFFVCLTMITNAMLQAYGHERLPVYTMPIGGLVKIVLNWVLIANPAIGVKGAAISSLACYFVISAINFVFICVKIPERPNFFKIFFKPVLASLVMGAVAYGGYKLLLVLSGSAGLDPSSKLTLCLAMAGAIVAACVAYAVMIIVFKAISKEELEMVPKGDKIGKYLRIK